METRIMGKKWKRLSALLVWASLSQGATEWHGSVPFATRSSLTGINYANGKFWYHTSSANAGYYSTDGLLWTSFSEPRIEGTPTSPYGPSAWGVAYENGLFLAHGQETFLTSMDGLHWTYREKSKCTIYDIAFGLGIWVGVTGCSSYPIAMSPDGVAWTGLPMDSVDSHTKIVFGNGIFVAIGGNGQVASSTDGVHWKEVLRRETYGHNWDVAYGNGKFIVLTDDFFDDAVTRTSTDGVNWTKKKLPPGFSGRSAILFAEGQFVIIGEAGGVWTSKDGEAWNRYNGGNYSMSTAIYGNGRYLVFSSSGISTSVDSAKTWTRYPAQEINYTGAAHTGNAFVTVGTKGTLVTSPDGVGWTDRVTATQSNLNGVAWGNQRAVVVGDSGTILTSTDLVEWKKTPGDPNIHFNGVVFADSVFVATSGSSIYTSPDGLTWERTYSLAEDRLIRQVAYGDGNWIALTQARPGTLLRSTDGYHWTRKQFPEFPNAFDGYYSFLAYGPAGFVFGGYNNDDSVHISATGESVVGVPIPAKPTSAGRLFLRASIYAYGTYMIGESNTGFLFYSSDARNWAIDSSYRSQTVTICFGGGKLLRVGPKSMAVTSLYNPTPVAVPPKHRYPLLPHSPGISEARLPVYDAAGRKVHGLKKRQVREAPSRPSIRNR